MSTLRGSLVVSSCFLLLLVAGELVPTRTAAPFSRWMFQIATLTLLGVVATFRTKIAANRAKSVFRALCGSVFAVLFLHLLYGPVYYKAGPLVGTIIDVATRKPVANATVRVEWRLRARDTLESDADAGLLHSESVQTVADGHYELPAWRRTLRPPRTWLYTQGPRIVVIVDGKRVAAVNNSMVVSPKGDSIIIAPPQNRFATHRTSDWYAREIPIHLPR
jgi:hypothetical protein